MRTMILIVAGLLTLAMACSFTRTPTPRPTYTPYPTYTPAPLIPVGTTSALPTPTINPKTFHRAGKKHWFTGDTAEAVERGKETFAQGKYQEALEEFLEAQRLHGEPSAALQSRIGNSYSALGQSKAAIRHFTNAIELEDTAIYRTNRGNLYVETRQCSLAIEDAKTALAMEPATGEGSHTDIEANIILVGCYIQQGNHLSALQHADAAYALATKHNVRAERAEGMRKQREAIQLILEGNAWPEDLFSDQVLAILETSLELYERGEHQAAIAQFKATQKKHGTPSGAIQAWIGTAYSALEQHETALTHYTKAIEIREDPHHRVIRGIEYANHGRCAEAAVDAEEALAMNPYAEPGYHTSAEAYWILAACLQEKTQAHMGKALAIAQANGYTQEEIDISSETVEAWIILKNPGKAITPMPPVPAATPKPTVEKTDLTSITDLHNAKWLQSNQPDAAGKLARLPWITDGVDPTEEKILEDLLEILIIGFRPGSLNVTGRPAKPVDTLLDMPFLQSIDTGDDLAIQSLRDVARKDKILLKVILGDPNLRSGITDEWTPIIATLWGAQEHNPSLIPMLLNPEQVFIESRNVELPHTGTVELHIVRLESSGNPKTMNILEEAVKNVEFFMSLPLPVQMVSVLFADSVTPSYTGNNFGSGITVLPKNEIDAEQLPGIFAHEVAHYYWRDNRNWIDEGMAEMIKGYHKWQTKETTMTASRYPCPHFSNIEQLERENPGTKRDAFRCNYSLGIRIFLDLWLELGDVPFREGAQRLYEQTKTGEAGVEEVRATFNRPETVERWYSSAKVGTVRGSAKVGTVRGIDENEPTWKLDEIHGTINDAVIILAKGGPKVESFSTRRHQGYAYLQFDYTHPTFIEDSWTVDLMMTEVFEDGFTYKVRPLELTVKGIHVGGSWRISVGPGKGRKWKPGKHIVMLHDQNGTKIAEVQWTVTQ